MTVGWRSQNVALFLFRRLEPHRLKRGHVAQIEAALGLERNGPATLGDGVAGCLFLPHVSSYSPPAASAEVVTGAGLTGDA